MNAPQVGIGSTVWIFDSNRRVYPKPPPGKIYAEGGPIWREHYGPHKIVGETRVSWVLDREGGRKIPKKRAPNSYICYSQEEIDEQCWIHENRSRISHLVNRLEDPAVLREVARLVNYQPKEK